MLKHPSPLAQNDNLQVHEEKSKGVYVKNLSDYYVSSAQEVYEIMRTGGQARIVSATSKYTTLLRCPVTDDVIRHERRILTIPLHLPRHHHLPKHRDRRAEDG